MAREACGTCGGIGWFDAPHPRDDPPRGLQTVAAALRARAMIERYGLDGWLRMEEIDAAHPLLFDAIEIFEGWLDRLEHRERVRDAKRERAKRK